MTGKSRQSGASYPVAVVVTISLFAVWGFANRVHDIVSPQFNKYLELTQTQATLSYASFGLSYLLLAIPAAHFLRHFGYKLGLVLGLCLFSIGAFLLYPSVTQHEPLYYLAATIATGGGWAVLETSANPLMLCMGRPETAVRRLNLAQAVYPLGLIAAVLLRNTLVVPSGPIADGQFLEAVVRPYIILGLIALLLAFLIENVEFPKLASERNTRNVSLRSEISELLSRQTFRFALFAMAIYTTGLVLIWSAVPGYARLVLPGISRADTSQFVLYAWIALACGRAIGTALMSRIEPTRLLGVFATIAAVVPLIALAIPSYEGIILLFSGSFFLGIMFPTIFGTAMDGLGDLTKTGSGLMVTAAGAGMCATIFTVRVFQIVPSFQTSLILAAVFFIATALYARHCSRAKRQNSFVGVAAPSEQTAAP